MDTLGVPHGTDTLALNINVIAEGLHSLLVSEWRIHESHSGLWSG